MAGVAAVAVAGAAEVGVAAVAGGAVAGAAAVVGVAAVAGVVAGAGACLQNVPTWMLFTRDSNELVAGGVCSKHNYCWTR